MAAIEELLTQSKRSAITRLMLVLSHIGTERTLEPTELVLRTDI